MSKLQVMKSENPKQAPRSSQFAVHHIADAYKKEKENIQKNYQKEAAMSVFQNMAIDEEVTNGQLLEMLQSDPELIEVWNYLPVTEFSRIVLGHEKTNPSFVREEKKKRIRLSNQQSTELKQLIKNTLAAFPGGLMRDHLAKEMNKEGGKLGLTPQEIKSKIRSPIVDLVKDGTLYKTGEKRGVRYILAEGKPSHSET